MNTDPCEGIPRQPLADAPGPFPRGPDSVRQDPRLSDKRDAVLPAEDMGRDGLRGLRDPVGGVHQDEGSTRPFSPV